MTVVELFCVVAIILLGSVFKVQSDSLEPPMTRLQEKLVELEETAEKIDSLKKSLPEQEEITCILRSGVDGKLVMQARRANTIPTDNRGYKDYLSCYWKELGYLTEDGELQWDNIRKVLEEKYAAKGADELINTCKDIKGITTGDTVALILRCMDDNVSVSRNIMH